MLASAAMECPLVVMQFTYIEAREKPMFLESSSQMNSQIGISNSQATVNYSEIR